MKRLKLLVVMISMLMVLLTGQAVYAGSQDASPLSGTVVETMDSAGYTYALLEKNGRKTWVAVPQMKIEKGQDVTFQPGMAMVNFKSKTLNRTFDEIYFSGGLLK